jgi:hypothetical protein
MLSPAQLNPLPSREIVETQSFEAPAPQGLAVGYEALWSNSLAASQNFYHQIRHQISHHWQQQPTALRYGLLPLVGALSLGCVVTHLHRAPAPIAMQDRSTQLGSDVGRAEIEGDRIQTVQFNPGKTATTYKDSLLQGSSQTYQLQAKGGQHLSLKVDSLNGNANLRLELLPLQRDRRRTLTVGQNWEGFLPESGDYRITVEPTRGDASYRLAIHLDPTRAIPIKPKLGPQAPKRAAQPRKAKQGQPTQTPRPVPLTFSHQPARTIPTRS